MALEQIRHLRGREIVFRECYARRHFNQLERNPRKRIGKTHFLRDPLPREFFPRVLLVLTGAVLKFSSHQRLFWHRLGWYKLVYAHVSRPCLNFIADRFWVRLDRLRL